MAIIKPNNNTISAITALPASITTGKVLQVVQVEETSASTVTSLSYTDSNLTASITPSSTSSKVLVLVNQSISQYDVNSQQIGGGIRILRGTTTIYGGVQPYHLYMQVPSGTNTQLYYLCNLNFLDSPSSTSSITYKTQIRAYESGDTIRAQGDNMESTITLMEIAG